MSESVAPSLSQYFGEKTDDQIKTIDLSQELSEASTKITDLKLDDNLPSAKKNEPEVCRIFAETPPQAKNQTTSFFDLIGNNHSVTSNGLISDLDITPNNDVSDLF